MTAAENTEKTPMDGAPEIDFDRFRPTRSAIQRRNIMDHFMRVLIAVAFVIACIPLISLLWTTIVNGIKRLNLNFLSYNMTGVVGGNQTRPVVTAVCCTPSSVLSKSPLALWLSPFRSV